LKSVGVQRPFPQINLIFRLLYEQVQKIDGLRFPFQPDAAFVDAFTDHFLELTVYDLRCVTQLSMKDEDMAGFCDWIMLRVLPSNPDFCKRADNAQNKHGEMSFSESRIGVTRTWRWQAVADNSVQPHAQATCETGQSAAATG